MKKLFYLSIVMLFSLTACEETKNDSIGTEEAYVDGDYSASLMGETGSRGESSANSGGEAGVITAGEWNDLDNWTFWQDLLLKTDSIGYPTYWSLFTNNRISVHLNNNGSPLADIKLTLSRNGHTVWQSRTNTKGNTDLWLGAFQKEDIFDLAQFTLKVNDETYTEALKFIEQGVININTSLQNNSKKVELAFIVDATGSMGDELDFLKEDLKTVIQAIEEEEPQLDILTGTVFYRDEGDDYLTKYSAFSSDIDYTLNYIKQQSANGGGDFPEAVHSALSSALNDLQWSTNARNRIAFLLLDAPPHYEKEVITNIQNTLKAYAEKGIKIIPITASGIDKKTEFLMRFMAILTNGTYVFITNDSGVGNEHIEASVGQYEVEKLNDLLVRIIKEYSK